jgi:hypothetical protein
MAALVTAVLALSPRVRDPIRPMDFTASQDDNENRSGARQPCTLPAELLTLPQAKRCV